MTPQQIGKVWTTIGFLLVYYALNSWIVSQGGKEVFGAKLLVEGKAPIALIAILVCTVLLLVNSLVGRFFAKSSGAAEWHARIPVVLFDTINTASREGKIYQGSMLAFMTVLPAAALAHFWDVVLSAHIASTDDPPKPVGNIWDWSAFHWNDPARICTTYQAAPTIVCGQNSTVLPGLEPTVLAIFTIAALVALVFHLVSVFRG